MVQLLQDWLSGDRNYTIGVQLFLQYGADERFLNVFKEPVYTASKERILLKAITELLQSSNNSNQTSSPSSSLPNEIKQDPVSIQTGAIENPTKNYWPENSADDILNALRAQWRPLYGELSNKQARIHDIALAGEKDSLKRQESAQMAADIVRLDKQIRLIYAKKSYYLKNGSLPEETPISNNEISGSFEQLMKKRENIARYMREINKKLAKMDPANKKRIGLIQRYKAHEELIIQINIKLSRPEYEGTPRKFDELSQA